ncbi:hypothetical protein ABZ016_00845 [Streptomyces sp. NPDC006372]|uniref:hypothetical protein n=1 Tax=Streptomyces sp. NPDC006372 TaxID=3155599 RepID=UPI0033B6B167
MCHPDPGKLQIYAVEAMAPLSATCIVRCVGGLVRPGRRFSIGSADEVSGERFHIMLNWIDRYEHRVDYFDPPHSARVHFSGSGAFLLKKGLTIISVDRVVG